uniref:Uncharacterized protein n=1 Tax=Aegilops tauschii subsp. strangulata TaxID=200361 RepID=A0A453HXU0_AEGTS
MLAFYQHFSLTMLSSDLVKHFTLVPTNHMHIYQESVLNVWLPQTM